MKLQFDNASELAVMERPLIGREFDNENEAPLEDMLEDMFEDPEFFNERFDSSIFDEDFDSNREQDWSDSIVI